MAMYEQIEMPHSYAPFPQAQDFSTKMCPKDLPLATTSLNQQACDSDSNQKGNDMLRDLELQHGVAIRLLPIQLWIQMQPFP